MSEVHENHEVQPEKNNGLTNDSTLTEVFNFLEVPEEGVQVVPVTIQQTETDTRLAILIRGDHEMASVIMARLMTEINDLSDLAEQRAANPPEQSQLVVPGRG